MLKKCAPYQILRKKKTKIKKKVTITANATPVELPIAD
jgi:hypothetical protein